ncbi:MAG: hypothetical protein ACWA6U_00585 [Breznakibacter sp.]
MEIELLHNQKQITPCTQDGAEQSQHKFTPRYKIAANRPLFVAKIMARFDSWPSFSNKNAGQHAIANGILSSLDSSISQHKTATRNKTSTVAFWVIS